MSACEHDWELNETGYVRRWITEFDDETKTIVATFTGSEDFSEEGNGDEHLTCRTCLETKPIPNGWAIDYA